MTESFIGATKIFVAGKIALVRKPDDWEIEIPGIAMTIRAANYGQARHLALMAVKDFEESRGSGKP